jgi:N-acyl-D-amino-acid deacylase
MWADVVIFDYARIQDRSTYQEPTLAPEGIDYVLVNGQVVIDQGKHTGARPGQVLYGPGIPGGGLQGQNPGARIQ